MTLSPEELAEMKDIQRRYALIKTQCESQVVRWEWADFARYDLLPYYFERYRFHRGNVVVNPQRLNGLWHYGFDDKNRVVVERYHVDADRFYEE